MRKRAIFARAFSWTRLSVATIYGRRFGKRRLPILAYHRVLGVAPTREFAFDPELVSATTDDFRWQMGFLKTHFEPITFEWLLDCLDAGEDIPRRAVIITFDDGYDDNYSQAFPVLLDCGIRATFFISTAYIGSNEPFWYDWLSAVILKSDAAVIELDRISQRYSLPKSAGERRLVYQEIVGKLKGVPNRERLATLREMRERYGHAFENMPDDERALSRPMSAAQLQEMAEAGMEIGSHTATHPILSRLTASELDFELSSSRARLQQLTGQNVLSLAYPNGGYDDFSPDVVASARKAGYRLGIAYVPGDNFLKDFSPFELKRIPVDMDTDRSMFELGIGIPGLID